ncbi:ferredoxin [Pseudonocardia sp.]|uniref:ferredoxin n=1 Tax=Pseudonocardia sp. TaxID=60912 RepID=UPI003D0AF7F3
MTTHRRAELRLRLDPLSCDGHGLCADLLPEHVTLDEWGYPILDDTLRSSPITPELLGAARAAVAACPSLALRLRRATRP